MYVDDVNQLLGDLHYTKVNLMGISYGTRVGVTDSYARLGETGVLRRTIGAGPTGSGLSPLC